METTLTARVWGVTLVAVCINACWAHNNSNNGKQQT